MSATRIWIAGIYTNNLTERMRYSRKKRRDEIELYCVTQQLAAVQVLNQGKYYWEVACMRLSALKPTTWYYAIIGITIVVIYTIALHFYHKRDIYKIRKLKESSAGKTEEEWEYRYCSPDELKPGDFIVEVYRNMGV